MQFHLDGFRTGSPDVHPAAPKGDVLDVLIVGCGPAGLTLAAQLAAFPEIRTRIVEQKTGPLALGQADGIACRTMEMFNAFGFAEKVLREALSYDFPRLLCDKGAAAWHGIYAGQRRGSDRGKPGAPTPRRSVIAPVFSSVLNGYPGSGPG